METYDLAVVGSGAGLMVVEAALKRGLRCAIVEKSKFGGTCLTKGCIPSKMLVYPADLIREAADAGRVGLGFSEPRVDWQTISDRMWKQIDFSSEIERNLKGLSGLGVYAGAGAFSGPNTMRVQYGDGRPDDEFRADRFVIAAGARSFVPAVDGLEDAGYVTAETFFGPKFPKAPWKRLVIVGGGAIGAEFAHIFSAFGAKVTLIEMQDRIIPTEEGEISDFVARQFAAYGIDVLTGARLISAQAGPSGKTAVAERIASGERMEIEADEIFISAGVRSNADGLALERAGVATDACGWIEVDAFLETSQPHIYAIGDIIGAYQFRHAANYEATVLSRNLFGGGARRPVLYDAAPWAVFTWPQVAHVGLTEAEALQKYGRIGIARNRYSSIAGGISMGYAPGAPDDGFAKILLTKDMRIVGVHVVGPYAAMLAQPFVYLINAGSPCRELCASVVDAEMKRQIREACPQIGSIRPVADSMVIHPSMNELTAWAIEEIHWVGDGPEEESDG